MVTLSGKVYNFFQFPSFYQVLNIVVDINILYVYSDADVLSYLVTVNYSFGHLIDTQTSFL